MSYELTWQFDANRAYTPPDAATQTKYEMWYLANALLGYIGGFSGAGLWTYVGSSDGTTADMSSLIANYKWGTPGTFDASKIVQTTADPTLNSHSWIILRSPLLANGAYCYMLIEAYNTTTAGWGLSNSVSTWSLAGTPTRQPTSTNQSPVAGVFNAGVTNDAATGIRFFNMCLATNGNFIYFVWKAGEAFPRLGIIFGNAYQASVSDQVPYYLVKGYAATTPGFATPSVFYTGANGVSPQKNFDLSAAGYGLNNFTAIILTGATSPSAFRPDQIDLLPFIIFFTDNSTKAHLRGRLQDVYWSHYTPPLGKVIKESGTIRFVCIGQLVIPFNTTPKFISPSTV